MKFVRSAEGSGISSSRRSAEQGKRLAARALRRYRRRWWHIR